MRKPPKDRPTVALDLTGPAGPPTEVVTVDRDWVRDLLNDWMANVARATVVSYRQDLKAFAAFMNDDNVEQVLATLLSGTEGVAHRIALNYKAHMLKQPVWRSSAARENGEGCLRLGLAPRTVNRRLAALRSLVKLARLGWKLEIPGIRVASVKDTAGVSREEYNAIVASLRGTIDKAKAEAKSVDILRGYRNFAIILLWHDMALRRAEVCGLDLGDLDLSIGMLRIKGKGRTEHESVPVPVPTAAVLRDYLTVRGMEPGPLFCSFSNRARGARLHRTSYNKILVIIAANANVEHANPHGFRHRAITRALDMTEGDIRKVAKYSRHRDPRTVLLYDDNRGTVQRDIGEMVASEED